MLQVSGCIYLGLIIVYPEYIHTLHLPRRIITPCPTTNAISTKVDPKHPPWLTFPLSLTQVQFSSVAQSCPTLCDPMNRSTPGLLVHHQLPEFTQTHVHWVGDAIQPSHPLLSPSPPAPNPSQHQSILQRVNTSQEVAKVLNFSFSMIPSKEHPRLISFRMDWLDLLVFSNTTVQKHQFFGAQVSSQSNSHIHTWPLEKP